MAAWILEPVSQSTGVLLSHVQNGDERHYTVLPDRIKGTKTCNALCRIAPPTKPSVAVSSADDALPLCKRSPQLVTRTSQTQGLSGHWTVPKLASLLSDHHSLPPCTLYTPHLTKSSFYHHEGLSFPLCRSKHCGLEVAGRTKTRVVVSRGRCNRDEGTNLGCQSSTSPPEHP